MVSQSNLSTKIVLSLGVILFYDMLLHMLSLYPAEQMLETPVKWLGSAIAYLYCQSLVNPNSILIMAAGVALIGVGQFMKLYQSSSAPAGIQHQYQR